MWGAIPLPDTDGSLREIEYIYDTLKLDGIGLLTSYDDGKLLGHPNFAPVLEELNRRKAVIFVHPTVSCCAMPIRHVNRVAIDFPTDTTRTITDLIYSGSLMRFPNIRWIFSHGGGTILMLAARLAGDGLTPEERAATIPNGFEHELQKLYYDVASVSLSPVAMAAVFKGIPKEHLLFGSDIPFFTIERIATAVNKFDVSAGDLRMIQRENALQLLPRSEDVETSRTGFSLSGFDRSMARQKADRLKPVLLLRLLVNSRYFACDVVGIRPIRILRFQFRRDCLPGIVRRYALLLELQRARLQRQDIGALCSDLRSVHDRPRRDRGR